MLKIFKYRVFHPYLFAIWLVIVFYSENYIDISIVYIFLPIIIVALVCSVLLFIVSFVFNEIRYDALVVTPLICFLLSYGIFYEFISSTFYRMRAFIIPISIIIFAALLFIYSFKLLRLLSIKSINAYTMLLNKVAVCLIVFSILQIAYFYYKYNNMNVLTQQDYDITYRFPGSPPDIYYIVLDEYAGVDQMKTLFNYDNNAFVDKLKRMGFYVANNSQPKYPVTGLSLATSLNMEYPLSTSDNSFSSIFMSISAGLEITRKSSVSDLLRHNKVSNILKCNNYKYIHIGSWYYDTMFNNLADNNINYRGFNINNPLIIVMANSSIIRLIFTDRYFQRREVLNALVWLNKIVLLKGPKFVFAHIISPHSPFLFGPNGEVLPAAKKYGYNDIRVYLGQHIFITKRIQEVIEDIIANSKVPPIIILQSDHGVRFDKLDEPSANKIFNAYLLPNNGKSKLYDSINPVNTFRLIFNYYFGAKYELLDDSIAD